MGSESDLDRPRYPRRVAEQAESATPGRNPGALPAATGPGKSVLMPNAGLQSSTVSHRVGNDWVDKGPGCEESQPGTAGCFLNGGQRTRITTSYQERVNAAQASYLAALGALRVEELMRAEPARTQWLFGILLDVIGMVASRTITNVATLIAAGQTETIASVVSNAGAAVQAAPAASAELGQIVGIGLGQAKARALMAHASSLAAPSTQKATNVAYLDLLGDSAGTMFEHLREDAIAGVSDGAMVVLFDAFRAAAGHTMSAYKQVISDKLIAFKKTGLGGMGVAKEPEASPGAAGGAHYLIDVHTKAFWVNTPIGRRLALYKRPQKPLGEKVTETFGWREQRPDELIVEKLHDISDHPFKFFEYVPAEFVPTAVQMHTAKWGSPPIEHAIGVDEIAQMGSNR